MRPLCGNIPGGSPAPGSNECHSICTSLCEWPDHTCLITLLPNQSAARIAIILITHQIKSTVAATTSVSVAQSTQMICQTTTAARTLTKVRRRMQPEMHSTSSESPARSLRKHDKKLPPHDARRARRSLGSFTRHTRLSGSFTRPATRTDRHVWEKSFF